MSPSSAERDAVFAATGAAARAPYISNDVIDQFLEASTPTQIAGRRAMLGAEVAHRDASRRARLLRQARLPVRKSVAAVFSQVPFSEMCKDFFRV
jgi:hypothetical protein